MKTRTIFSALFFICSACTIVAQEYKIPAENTKDGVLSLAGFSGELTIEGYSGNEIIFSSLDGDVETPERAKGLKPVYPSGTDNTGLGLSVEKNGSMIEVSNLLPFTKRRDVTVRVPENISIRVESECQYNTNISISHVKNEIEIETCHDINLKDVSGPLVLSTISGNIEITFGTINTGKPFSINSVSGEIDITLPSKLAADIEMQTISGAMYSDFDFSQNDTDMKRIGGGQINSKLNGGGTKFSIMTVSSNIYLRKGI